MHANGPMTTSLPVVDFVCVLGTEKAACFNGLEGNVLCIHENLR